MGDVRLTVQKVLKAGIDLTDNAGLAVAATSTYKVANDGRTFLHFKKSAAVICNVIVDTPATLGGYGVDNLTIVVAAGPNSEKHAGPFPTRIFNDGNGDLRFTLSDVDGLTCALAKL